MRNKSKKVLFVEDDADDFSDYQPVLVSRGYAVIQDTSWRNATKNVLPTVEVAFVVLDVVLGKREQTDRDIRRWRRESPAYADLPILMLTAYYDREACERLSEETWPELKIGWCSKQKFDARVVKNKLRSPDRMLVFEYWIDKLEGKR